jgi:DNA-binding transcriptional ArsR family regulator
LRAPLIADNSQRTLSVYPQVNTGCNRDTIIERLKGALLLVYFLLSFRNMQDKFLKLTDTVYKVLEFFPESDPLKNRAKDKALAIMDNLVLINDTSGWASFQNEKIKIHILEDIDMLLGHLWIAKSQGWLNSANFLIISNEYEKIRNQVAPIIDLKIEMTKKLPGIDISQESEDSQESVLNNTEADNSGSSVFLNISERQRKIIDFLSNNEKAQVMDLQTVLGDITKRTIRRDLDELLLAGKITRLGEFNNVFYRLRG